MCSNPPVWFILMKSQMIKTKALELYVTSVSVEKICKQLKLSKTTFYEWQRKGQWEGLREKAIQKLTENTTNDIITLQSELGRLASKELLAKLKLKKLADKELVILAKHGLEVVRPRQTTNNLNITKNENTSYQIVIPKEVEELLSENLRVDT